VVETAVQAQYSFKTGLLKAGKTTLVLISSLLLGALADPATATQIFHNAPAVLPFVTAINAGATLLLNWLKQRAANQ
jgi:hypothetical protein